MGIELEMLLGKNAWTMLDGGKDNMDIFPSSVMLPGQSCLKT
jgi:hypothetical protein